jgi:hypothetical protein
MTEELVLQRKRIINGIIEKGGLLGMAAEYHAGSEENSHGLLGEFFEQCPNKSLWEFWGPDLVLDLINYWVKHLRYQFDQLFKETSTAYRPPRNFII